VLIADRQREKVSKNGCVLRIRRGLRNKIIEFRQFLDRRVAAFKPSCTLDLACERVESAVGMMRRAEIAQRDVWLILEPLIKRSCNVRLPETCLPSQHYNTALTQGGVSPPPQQQLDLLFSSV
jgi:hypothetical protein